jgi:hypothetical protein
MKNDPFDVVEKYRKPGPRTEAPLVKTDITEGPIIAVEICSNVIEAHIWLAFDDDFNPGDGLAVFYDHELEYLKTKTPEQLRQIHQTKLDYYCAGSKVRK